MKFLGLAAPYSGRDMTVVLSSPLRCLPGRTDVAERLLLNTDMSPLGRSDSYQRPTCGPHWAIQAACQSKGVFHGSISVICVTKIYAAKNITKYN